MDEIKGVTKNDLLKLKHSKPVPIVAHSMEVVVPVVYSTRVKEFMKREGMKVPLSPEQLSGLKKKARETEGEPDPSYAVGGIVKSRAKERKRLVKGLIPSDLLSKKRKRAAKVKAPGKRLKDSDLKKPSNVKQVVNISLQKIMRTPSTRAKPASNLPIRPGASIAPTTTEPYYQRLVTPTMPPNTTVPGTAPVTTSNVAPVSSLVKEVGEPIKQGDLGLVKDAAVQTNVLRKRPLVAPVINPYTVLKTSNFGKEAAEKSKTFKMMGEQPPPGMKRGPEGTPVRKVGKPPSILSSILKK